MEYLWRPLFVRTISRCPTPYTISTRWGTIVMWRIVCVTSHMEDKMNILFKHLPHVVDRPIVPSPVKRFWTDALRNATMQGANARLSGFSEDINPYQNAELKQAFHFGYTFVYRFI